MTATKTQTKRVQHLQVGDMVAAVDGVTLDRTFTVQQVKGGNVKGAFVAGLIRLDGGRFWTTGAADMRTCEVVK